MKRSAGEKQPYVHKMLKLIGRLKLIRKASERRVSEEKSGLDQQPSHDVRDQVGGRAAVLVGR